jgi:hypothetical protein
LRQFASVLPFVPVLTANARETAAALPAVVYCQYITPFAQV